MTLFPNIEHPRHAISHQAMYRNVQTLIICNPKSELGSPFPMPITFKSFHCHTGSQIQSKRTITDILISPSSAWSAKRCTRLAEPSSTVPYMLPGRYRRILHPGSTVQLGILLGFAATRVAPTLSIIFLFFVIAGQLACAIVMGPW